MPPGPVSVSNRVPPSRRVASTTSASRPTKLVSRAGRVFGSEPRVQTDAHADGAALRPFVRREAALGVGGCAACVERALEDAEERVAFGPQLGAFPALEGLAQDGVVVHLGLDVLVAQLLHELGRA